MAISPTILPGDCLRSGNNTVSSVWFVSTPGVSTGDLVIWHLGWDDSVNTVSSNASTAPDGGAITRLVFLAPASQSNEVRGNVYYKIATTSWAATTVRFTPSAAESWTAVVCRVKSPYFNSSTPIGTYSTYNLNPTTSPQVSSPAFTASTTDAFGRLMAWNVIDADPVTSTPAGWTSTNALDLGDVTHCFSNRNALVSSAESIPNYSWGIAGDSSITVAYIIRANPNGSPLTGVSAGVLQTGIVPGISFPAQLTGQAASSSIGSLGVQASVVLDGVSVDTAFIGEGPEQEVEVMRVGIAVTMNEFTETAG